VPHFGFVVEGHGEVLAVPLLVRRLLPGVITAKPVRITKSKLIKPGELERAIQLAFATNGAEGPVLVVLDADDDCPAMLGPQLKKRAISVAEGQEISIVIAKCEFEAWFLAAAESLAGKRGLKQGLSAPADPEAVRGAKEWLTKNMSRNSCYSPTVDQAALAAAMDLNAARCCRSFDRFCRKIGA
jgi:hypothetical protein